MKRLVLVLLILGCLSRVEGQNRNVTGSITAASTDCSVAGSCVTLLKSANDAAVALQVAGSYSATLQFEGSVDYASQGANATWFGLTGFPYGPGAYPSVLTAATATNFAGGWQFATTGLTGLRVRCSSLTSGSASLAMQAGTAPPVNNVVVGPVANTTRMAASNSSVAVNPVLIGGTDTTGRAQMVLVANGRLSISLDQLVGNTIGIPGTLGTMPVAGADSSGSATTGYPVLMGAASGSNTQTLVMDPTNSGLKTSVVNIPHVVCDSGCSSSTAPADNSAFTAGTTSSSPASGFYHATRDSLTDGRIGAIALNVNRAQLVQLEDSSKNEIGTAGKPIWVNASTANVNVTCSNCSGSGASAADEATVTPGTSTFAPSGGFFQTTATNNALTNLQQGMLQATAQRALFTNLRNASGTEMGTTSNPLQVTLANTGANATAVKVDGSAVTQPVSGTFWQATQPVSIADGSDTTLGAKADAKSTATDTTAVSIMSVLKEISAMEQAPASRAVTGTFWQATQPVSGTVTANQGTAAAGSGAWPMTVTNTSDTVVKPGDSVNNAVRVNVVAGGASGGTSSNFGNGNAFPSTGTAAGFNDPSGNMAGAKVDANGYLFTNSDVLAKAIAKLDKDLLATLPTENPLNHSIGVNVLAAPILDPCQMRKTNYPVSQTANTQVVTSPAGLRTYVCGVFVDGADAENLSLVYGTGSTCGTGTTAMIGGTTAATGPNMAANGGWVQGFASATVADAPAGQNVCLFQSGSGRVAGNLSIVFAP